MLTNIRWLDAVEDRLAVLEATEVRDEEVCVYPLDTELPVTEFRLFFDLELKHRKTVGANVKFPILICEVSSQF